MDDGGAPWQWYSRARAVAGWTFPVGRARIRDALLAADARVRYLSLGGGFDGGPYGLVHRPRPHTLLRCWWSTDSDPTRRPDREERDDRGGWAGLDLYAVPSADAADARRLLIDGLLDEAAWWIGRIGDSGEAWRASDHESCAVLEAGALRRVET